MSVSVSGRVDVEVESENDVGASAFRQEWTILDYREYKRVQ